MPKRAVVWKVVFFQRPRGRCFSRGRWRRERCFSEGAIYIDSVNSQRDLNQDQ